jgi:hypothetical protein
MNKLVFIFALVFSASMVHAKTDWIAPLEGVRYDWRNTHWFGLSSGPINIFQSGGTAFMPGLSYKHWGEERGISVTACPVYDINENRYALSLGLASLFSFNHPKPSEGGQKGFTTFHTYWYLAAGYGRYNDFSGLTQASSASIGIGIDLNRRDSQFGILLGLGPYYTKYENQDSKMQIYPNLEINWHFGAPRRISK